MEIGKLQLKGIEVNAIESVELTAEWNQHACLNVKCLVEKEHVDSYASLGGQKEKVTLMHEDTRLFSGIVTAASCKVEKGKAILMLDVTDSTWQLDRKKKSRSFQDVSKTFQEVAEKIHSCIFHCENKVTGKLILQYQETDWEFLKRLASKCNTMIYADMTSEHMALYFGVNGQKKAIKPELYDCIRERNLEKNTYACIFESPDFINIGDVVELDGRKLVVDQMQMNAKKAQLVGTYHAMPAEDCMYPVIYCPDMAGAALQGTVIESQKDKVKVHLAIDEGKESADVYLFPFSAMQASSDGSGWYYMPEVGDCVKVCIPAWEEKGAFAVSAVSTYDGAADAQDMMGDTSVKYMRNLTGKQIQLTPGGIAADGGGQASGLQMGTDGTIAFTGKQAVTMKSSESITIVAMGDLNIHADETIDIKAETTGELVFDDAGEITELGGQVNINAEE